MKSILLSLLAFSSIAVASEVQVAEVKAEVSFKDQVVYQATSFVEHTVNMIATPFLSDRDVECLARNIFYESGAEPLEGKVAVGMVTINRSQDPRYPNTVCGVVNQRTVIAVPKKTREIKTVAGGFFQPVKQVEETKTTWVQKAVYQFSWVGQRNIRIRQDDPRWIESKRVAEELARGGYEEWQVKYAEAKNFHAIYVKPGWRLPKIGRVGNHIFYEGQPQQGG